MQTNSFSVPQRRIARLARQKFVEGLCGGLAALDKAIADFLISQVSQKGTPRELHTRQDTWQLFQKNHRAWTTHADTALRDALAPHVSSRGGVVNHSTTSPQFELLSDDVVENRILASRMALTVTELTNQDFDTTRLHTQALEGQELDDSDLLRPQSVCRLLIDAWSETDLSRAELQLVMDPLQKELARILQAQYQALNAFFAEEGLTLQNDYKSKVKRTPDGPTPPPTPANAQTAAANLIAQALAQSQQAQAQAFQGGWQGQNAQPGMRAPNGPGAAGMGGGASGNTPLARARHRAQGVMGQLRRLLVQPGVGIDMANAPPASAALVNALSAHRLQANTFYDGAATTMLQDYGGPAVIVQMAGVVRERTVELKKKAATAGEKAIIEVVALMFQSILAEDRIPSAVRVWFSRLQVPVLRVALAEPEFFSNATHPARLLIDRMGACVMGFNATAAHGTALESEIRRVVQVIEQYPETGRRVFQLVYDEFEKFLAKFLTEKNGTSRLVSVAQQVEQKETLTIQYTIELRNMLRDMPVRDEIRDFLFKSWSEVLALSAVRNGPQHADTIALKQAGADLVWAASAKPNRQDRAQVIQSLPKLLQSLRQGLGLLGVAGTEQDTQIKVLTDTLAEAFLSKTAAIPQDHIDALAKRLAHLEDFISDDTLGDIPLNAENIEMMLGFDASSIHVVADNGAPVDAGMLEWAQQLQTGAWYTLDHNGASAQVQYAWHSARKQLHLFASVDGTSYLIQQRRLGAYLQAGLLVAQDDEGITLRATRDALKKLDANPERLLD